MQEANEKLALQVIDLGKLDIQLEHPPVFPAPREGSFQPDYHAGAVETAQMATFFPERVRTVLAKQLQPQDSFHPYAYCGDPASYDLEKIGVYSSGLRSRNNPHSARCEDSWSKSKV